MPCSDKPGQHDFNLLKKLVLPDGSILRAKLPGRPTRDCLFSDPARDGIRYLLDQSSSKKIIFFNSDTVCNVFYFPYVCSLLKIWNLNDFNGVVGVFNCQGAGWCKVGKKNLIHDYQPETITGIVRANDVNYLPKIAHDGWTGDAILYSHLHSMNLFSKFIIFYYDYCFHLEEKCILLT